MNTQQLRELIAHLTQWQQPLEQALAAAQLETASVPDFILDLQTALDVMEGKNHADDDS